MQRSYFLGGSGSVGFETGFWAEHRECYSFLLKGGPGTGKSTLMKKIAAAFSGETVSVYHCASDPQSLDAVVLEDRGVLVADATQPHESSTPLPYVTGELIDLAAGIDRSCLNKAEILRLYEQNQKAHALARKGIAGMTVMEDMICGIGKQALLSEKLDIFAGRFAKTHFSKKDSSTPGIVRNRQLTALTPKGKMTLCPVGWSLTVIHDRYFSASQQLLQRIARLAAENGVCCEQTCSLTQTDRPLTALLLPDCRSVLLSQQSLADEMLPQPEQILNAERFYNRDVLRAHRTLTRFCEKSLSAVSEQTVLLLAEALDFHDQLESYYIATLDLGYLNRLTAELIARIQQYPRRNGDE